MNALKGPKRIHETPALAPNKVQQSSIYREVSKVLRSNLSHKYTSLPQSIIFPKGNKSLTKV